jgi:hypothetical protein
VTASIPEGVIAAGNPARVVRPLGDGLSDRHRAMGRAIDTARWAERLTLSDRPGD